ncbi:MAG: DUF1616 domain-containing protein [Candidatus Bathyarchaeia archaeon]|jgi:uncharacterized membrane protein
MIGSSLKAHFFSKQTAWFWITVTIALVTSITIFTIPDYIYPIAYVRSILSLIFKLFLPGFALVKMLYPSKLPIQISSKNSVTIECVAVSLGLSIVLVPIIGLLLYYTPWGIGIAPITFSLLALTITFGMLAILKQYKRKNLELKNQPGILNKGQ